MAREQIEGMRELERTFKRLGNVPQTVATQAARAGATIGLRAARKNAPVKTGTLKRGIIMKREKRSKPGKAVYDVMMDPQKNDLFQKETKSGTRRVGGKGDDANLRKKGGYYYPASQEYGFMTADGRYIQGKRFLGRSLTENTQSIRRKMIDVAGKAIEKAMKKR